jgi:hypothetical protein
LVLLAVGTFGIVHQEITGHFNLPSLGLYATAIGIPGALGVRQLARGSQDVPPTTSPSQSPPASVSPPPSSS